MHDSESRREKAGMGFVLLAAMLWGTTGTAQGLAPPDVHPTVIGAMRLAVGGLSLLPLAMARGAFAGGGAWPLLSTALSAVLVAAYQLCFFAGVAKTGVAVGTMVAIGSAPVAAGILGYLVRKERMDLTWGMATVLAVSGCALLSASGGASQVDPLGIALALGAGFSYAAYTLTIKGLLDRHAPDAVMAVVFSLAAVLLSPLLFLADLSWLVRPRGLAVALHLGVVATALSYWLFARGLRRVPVGTAATLSLAEPLTAALLAVGILGERLEFREICGAGLLFAGIALLALAPSIGKRNSAPSCP